MNNRQKEAIEYLKGPKSIKSGGLKEMFSKVSRETLRKDLRDLTERGIIKKTGAKRDPVYTYN